MAIAPISIPSSAGLNYGNADCRHVSEGDALDVPGLANPTRYLAYRDTQLATKLNETIEVVNNNEQYVPMPVMRTTLSPNSEEIVSNWRIPPGFEARVLNAIVSAQPASGNIELNIYYAQGFGNNTGTVLVTTSTESEPQTSFKSNGELIVALKNKGTTTLEMAASVLFTVRPIGGRSGLLVGNLVKGDKGDPGGTGTVGPVGPAGTGAAGSPGMVWTGVWITDHDYGTKEVVSFVIGAITSSYICNTAHHSSAGNQPPDTGFWDLVATGSTGATGATGPVGPSPTSVVLTAASVNGTLVTGSDWVGEAIEGYASNQYAASSQYFRSVYETTIKSSTGTISTLNGNWHLSFLGSGTIVLPKQAYGANVDYNNASVLASIIQNGSSLVQFGSVIGFTCNATSNDSWTIKSLAAAPSRCAITIVGAQFS